MAGPFKVRRPSIRKELHYSGGSLDRATFAFALPLKKLTVTSGQKRHAPMADAQVTSEDFAQLYQVILCVVAHTATIRDYLIS